ncbi:tetratricopeptide repeat protein 29 isoform X2 [Scophthalmus maximus]|uniref:tetratricopeptide repeat protein 29 isoform X2 n=1 Tax=Scophthalmus maximus TaxID=52904 RepID=UPI001FA82F64|nr:tetratricopeptide repeat protein 29 isoform X2 [Scophthalmus maximus]
MDAAAAAKRRRAGSLLPEVTSKRGRSSQNRAKPDNESLHTSSEWDESAQVASKREIALFRNSLKQNVCVRMLQEGNHRSFSELFYLLQAERDRRAAAEPSSALSSELRPLLEEQREKLETVRLHMCEAEQAERTGSWPAMCEHRLFLGQFFSAPEDQLLSLHFFHSCADREQGRSSRPATEARACMAELYLQQGELEEARQQAELCIRQAEDGGWLDLSGRPLRLRARQTLWRIYDQLAVAPMDAANYSEALELLHKGYSMATESDDKQIEGEAAHRLGLAYQRTGDHNTAKKFFNTYMQICVTMNDAGGIGKAYKAMAKSMESEGNMEETIRCLEELVHITRINGLLHNLADACLLLGNIYCTTVRAKHINIYSHYIRALEFFIQGYEVSCETGDVSLQQKAQVLVARARAQSLLGTYGADVVSASPGALRRLLVWKNTRETLGAQSRLHRAES